MVSDTRLGKEFVRQLRHLRPYQPCSLAAPAQSSMPPTALSVSTGAPEFNTCARELDLPRLFSRSSAGPPLIPAPGRTVGKWHFLIDRSSYICYFCNEFAISAIVFVATRSRAQPRTRRSLDLCLRPDGLPGMGRYPAVLSLSTPPAVENSCGEGVVHR